jgi:uncharacterized protein GlcG (DUF336 family)
MQDCEKPGEKNMLSRHRSLMAPLLGLLLLVLPHTLPAQLRDVKLLTLEAAKTMANAAEARARANGWTVAIAVVDASGDLLVFYRLDGTQLGSIDIAIGKARTAPRFRRPTKSLDDRIGAGRLGRLAVDDILPLEGGVPITLGEQVIGGIGVSGMASNQDALVARAGAAALRPSLTDLPTPYQARPARRSGSRPAPDEVRRVADGRPDQVSGRLWWSCRRGTRAAG